MTPLDAGNPDTVFAVFHRSETKATVRLPKPPEGMIWWLGLDTRTEDFAPRQVEEETALLSGPQVVAFYLAPADEAAA